MTNDRERRAKLSRAHLRPAGSAAGVPRGRKRAGWKAELLEAVEDVAGDLPSLSEQKVLTTITQYRRKSRAHPVIKPAPKA